MQLTEAELDEKYGEGLALMKALGWSHGQTLGASTSESALVNPLKTASPLSVMVPSGSVEAHMRKDPEVLKHCEIVERRTKEFHPYEWKPQQVREGNVAMWRKEQKEYPLGRYVLGR